MKKSRSFILLSFLSLVMIGVLACVKPVTAYAEESTFSGTVSDKTTSDTLYLVTSGGTMQIKIDAGTDLSGARFLLPGKEVTCSCSVINEYWHASRISGSGSVGQASVDTSKQYTVTGKIGKNTNEGMLYLKTGDGTMEIKLDTNTDISGLKAFIAGSKVQVVCSRGSDAYMHAISVSDNASSVSAQTQTAAPAVESLTAPAQESAETVNVVSRQTDSITGTVDKKTTSAMLYLSTSGGVMQFVIDSTAYSSACRALIPGQSVTVAYYRGSDEWMHAATLTNNSSKPSAATTLDESTLTVSGKVGSLTNEGVIYLVTSGGTMQIRIDPATDFSGCKVLIKDKSVQVNCRRGADEYYHAVSISGN